MHPRALGLRTTRSNLACFFSFSVFRFFGSFGFALRSAQVRKYEPNEMELAGESFGAFSKQAERKRPILSLLLVLPCSLLISISPGSSSTSLLVPSSTPFSGLDRRPLAHQSTLVFF